MHLVGAAHPRGRRERRVDDPRADRGDADAVAVELCPSRYNALLNPDELAKMDLFRVLRDGKAPMVVASLALGAYQQRLADQFGIEPGAEQRQAIRSAQDSKLPILLIDREIGITLKRVLSNVSWWKRFALFTGLLVSVISREEVSEEEIEGLKEGDMLETTFAEFAADRQDLFLPLISERDRYMAARLLQEVAANSHENILAVIGAGHLKGIREHLEQGIADPARIGVSGWSNGGYLTNCMIVAEPDMFAAASSGAGVLGVSVRGSVFAHGRRPGRQGWRIGPRRRSCRRTWPPWYWSWPPGASGRPTSCDGWIRPPRPTGSRRWIC